MRAPLALGCILASHVPPVNGWPLGLKRDAVLTKVLDFFRGGSRDFNEAEKRLLSFLMDGLPANEREVLSRQLGSIRLVQRQHPGRLVVAYYKNQQDVPQLPYPGYEYCLARVSYKSKGRTKATSVVLHNGRFMSFERNVPETPRDIESLGAVILHPEGYRGVAEDIDTEAHGEQQST